jgi:hypothetical protein
MRDRTEEYFLHRVFGIFRMTADLHTEGVNRVLEQPDRFLNGFRSIAVQQIGGSYQFRSHRIR